MKNIDVFMDLEGLGISWGRDGGLAKVEFIADELTPALNREGYALASVTGFACYNRKGSVAMPLWMRAKLIKKFTSYGWKMIWSHDIADHSLIADVRKHLSDGTLAEAVMLVASDHDFVSLVQEIMESGRFVLISGTNMSKKLQTRANRTLPFWEFLGGHPEKILPGDTSVDKYRSESGTNLNPILFPKI